MTSRSSDRVSIDSEGHSILSRALARSSAIISGSCSSSNRPVLCSCGQRRGCQDRPRDPQWSPDPPWLGERGAGPRNSCMVCGRCRPGLGDTGRGSMETADCESPHLTANGWQEPEGPECCPGLKSPQQERSSLPSPTSSPSYRKPSLTTRTLKGCDLLPSEVVRLHLLVFTCWDVSLETAESSLPACPRGAESRGAGRGLLLPSAPLLPPIPPPTLHWPLPTLVT